jgi:hypothetical protein
MLLALLWTKLGAATTKEMQLREKRVGYYNESGIRKARESLGSNSWNGLSVLKDECSTVEWVG